METHWNAKLKVLCFLFKGFLMPFLYKLRNDMDRMWMDTAAALYHWREVENVSCRTLVSELLEASWTGELYSTPCVMWDFQYFYFLCSLWMNIIEYRLGLLLNISKFSIYIGTRFLVFTCSTVKRLIKISSFLFKRDITWFSTNISLKKKLLFGLL